MFLRCLAHQQRIILFNYSRTMPISNFRLSALIRGSCSPNKYISSESQKLSKTFFLSWSIKNSRTSSFKYNRLELGRMELRFFEAMRGIKSFI